MVNFFFFFFYFFCDLIQKYFLSGEISKYDQWKKHNLYRKIIPVSPCEMCPNTEFFLVGIFPHSDWIRRGTSYLSVLSPNVEKYGPEKNSLFGQFSCSVYFWNRCLKAIDLFYKQTNGLIYRLNGLFSSGLDDNFLKIEKFI